MPEPGGVANEAQPESRLDAAWLGTVDYAAALTLQGALVEARRYDKISDTLLLLEHPHVFTLGRGADERYLTDPPPAVPIHRVSRGGQVTYHGPGQLIGYPIIKLEGRERDVHRYLRTLEQVIIEALAAIGIVAGRRDKLTGVWVATRKIASIGVGIRRWVTFHGFAVNVEPEMSYFKTIVPCGIDGCEMTSIAELTVPGKGGLMERFASLIQQSFAVERGYRDVRRAEVERLWHYTEDQVAGVAIAPGGDGHD
jgi:lipoate-protein ligase B